MKKLFLLVFTILSFVNGWATTTTPSFDENSGLYYIIEDGNATITNSNNKSDTSGSYENTAIVIPSEIIFIDESGTTTYAVTSIGSSAFYGCTSLTSVVIPEGVTSIGSSAFYGCTSLTSVVIPEGVTSIGSSAFNGCTSLTSVVITEGVTSIGSYAFYGCTSLTSVVIPASVQEIGASAFNACSSLTAVYFKAESIPTVKNNVFKSVSSDICYYVPYGCTEKYTSLSPLVEFYFDDDFFYDLKDETASIYFTTIPYTATSITIPDTFIVDGTGTTYTITAIESGLFANFTSLTEVFVNWTDPIGIDVEGLFSEDIKKVATLYVPEETVETYRSSNWAIYFGNIGVYVEEEEQGEDRKDEGGGTDDDGDEDNEPGTGTGGDDDVPGTGVDEGGGTDDDDDEENVPGTGTGEGGGTDDDDDDNQDLDESTNYTVVDGIKYEIIDDDLVQIVGATAENIVFVTEVEIEESTYDVDSVVADAFIDYTDLTASVTFIDPEKIGVDGDSYSEKVGTLTVPDGCVDMYNRSDWTKIFTISGNDYLLSDDVYYIFKSSSLKSSSASKKITLEVDHVSENATSVTIPEDIYLDNYGYFNVTSINSTAFDNCDAIETLTIEADIPVTDAEALTTLSDNCILIVADVYEGKYDELLASTNITIITKSESVTNIKNLATEKVEVARYNILGQQLSTPCPGINLIKYSDGTVKKVIVK